MGVMTIRTLGLTAVILRAHDPQSKRISQNVFIHPGSPGAFLLSGGSGCQKTAEAHLILHNNYRFPITVTLLSDESGAAKPSYEVVATDSRMPRVLEQVEEDVSTSQEIESGKQVSFCIPTATFAAGKYVRVPFRIVGETDTVEASAPEHFAVFHAQEGNK
jgi:hypothetical protein